MEWTQTITENRVGDAPRHRAPAARTSETPRLQARTGSLEKRALGLGWFSIGLGLAELIAPRQVARLIGADEDDPTTSTLLMGAGVRELVSGVGLLSQSRPAAWAWARVAGDLMDLALLGYFWQGSRVSQDRMLAVGGSVLAITAADAQTAFALGAARIDPMARGIFVKQAVTVQKPQEEAYSFFRDLENLPRFMQHLESVEVTNGSSHWRAKGPLGMTVEWDAEVVDERPNERIAWRSRPGADVPNQGAVRFRPAPGGLGTEIEVELHYEPPAGAIGATVAQLFGAEPAQAISADLRRLKQVLETGEVLHSDASIHRGMHPARPSLASKGPSKRELR